jgi:hypothetical protein
MHLDTQTRNTILDLMRPHMNTADKREMRMRDVFNNAGKQPPSVDYSGAIDEANNRIINFLIDYTEIVPGKQALWALLESFLNDRDYGVNKQLEIRDLEQVTNGNAINIASSSVSTPANLPVTPSATAPKLNSEQTPKPNNQPTTSTNSGKTGNKSINQASMSGCLAFPNFIVRRIYDWWQAQPIHWKWFWGVFGAAVIGLATVASPVLPFFIREATNTPEPTVTTEVPEETPPVVNTDEATEEPIVTSTSYIREVPTLTDTPIPVPTEAPTIADTPVPSTTEAPIVINTQTTPDITQRTLPIIIYVSEGQLAIYIEDNSDGRSLEQLVFIDNDGGEHELKDYDSFNTYFRFTNSEAGDRCLIIFDPTIRSNAPQNCQNTTLNNFPHDIASVDIFWWEGSIRPFSVSNSMEIIGNCTERTCEITYIEPQ